MGSTECMVRLKGLHEETGLERGMVLSEPLSTKLGLASNRDIGDKQHMEEGTNSPVGKRLKITMRGIAKE